VIGFIVLYSFCSDSLIWIQQEIEIE